MSDSAGAVDQADVDHYGPEADRNDSDIATRFTSHTPECDDADFGFVCPQCDETNPLKGDPDDFGNRPFRCVECGYVPLLSADALDAFKEARSA